jgi:hypothetical protein
MGDRFYPHSSKSSQTYSTTLPRADQASVDHALQKARKRDQENGIRLSMNQFQNLRLISDGATRIIERFMVS